ncbi:hypothetical protein CKO11_03460 [Rhodobacter sp. TJ_12]|uniref:hypothetical protein n=1 Tax=Rhodobacter sp. TJ_12 TaxID=2029399 RepID=UPI001CC02A1B|nr:hypothetical protein [Rhodobacter sp. TJ_12]MBZ4021514.1 hypothetical protein [Rhodobacter sp. TJ_12]
MIKAGALILLAMLFPLYFKYNMGSLEQQASDQWRAALYAPEITEAFAAQGLTLVYPEQADYADASGPSCSLWIAPADPQGQFLGLFETRAATSDRLGYLYRGRIHTDFPYRRLLFGHISYLLLHSVGLSPSYHPAVAVFETGPCPQLDPLRHQI